jgi:hypothetical protein
VPEGLALPPLLVELLRPHRRTIIAMVSATLVQMVMALAASSHNSTDCNSATHTDKQSASRSNFALLKVSADTSLDSRDSDTEDCDRLHYAFLVTEVEFDDIVARLYFVDPKRATTRRHPLTVHGS